MSLHVILTCSSFYDRSQRTFQPQGSRGYDRLHIILKTNSIDRLFDRVCYDPLGRGLLRA